MAKAKPATPKKTEARSVQTQAAEEPRARTGTKRKPGAKGRGGGGKAG